MTNFNSNLNNLLKNLSANLQKNSQNKTTENKEQKQENLFNLSNVNINKLDNNDLYGGMVSISKKDTPSDNVKEKAQKSVNTNLNNLLKNLKNDTKTSLNTPEVKSEQKTLQTSKNVQNQQTSTTLNTSNLSNLLKNSKINLTNINLKSASMLSPTPTVQTVSETPQVITTAPVVEKTVSQIQAENLEKTINSIDKYIARIDLNLVNETCPLSPFGVKHYDFTDYTSEYDEQNRVTKLVSKYNTGVNVDITYDENSNMNVNCDNGRTFTINAKGQLTSYNPYEPNKYTYEYDNDGKLIKTTHNQGYGNIVTYSNYTYDEHGNMVENGSGGKFINTYDEEGHLISVATSWDKNKIEYDTNGNIIKENSITYEYDENNNFVKATDEKGNEYDKYGKVIKYTSIENGVTLTREAKIAENGQKIIVKDMMDDVGNSRKLITDINGFYISEAITLSDGTTIEVTLDSKQQDNTITLIYYPLIEYEDEGYFDFPMYSNVININSMIVKKYDGTIAYTFESPYEINKSDEFFLRKITNQPSIMNLSFNNGEHVLVNKDGSLTVTKTDKTIDIYNYDKKTRTYELRPPANLNYDHNKDGVFDYLDFFEIAKLSNSENDSVCELTAEALLKNLPANIDLNYLLNFAQAKGYNRNGNKASNLYLYYGEDRVGIKQYWRIFENILEKIDKEQEYDLNKDGNIDEQDVEIFNDLYNYGSGKGLDIDGNGIYDNWEQRIFFGKKYAYTMPSISASIFEFFEEKKLI